VFLFQCKLDQGCVKLDAEGHVTEGKPILLLPEDDPDFIAVDRTPVSLKVALLYER
jgi:hypothetical protein